MLMAAKIQAVHLAHEGNSTHRSMEKTIRKPIRIPVIANPMLSETLIRRKLLRNAFSCLSSDSGNRIFLFGMELIVSQVFPRVN